MITGWADGEFVEGQVPSNQIEQTTCFKKITTNGFQGFNIITYDQSKEEKMSYVNPGGYCDSTACKAKMLGCVNGDIPYRCAKLEATDTEK